MINLPGKALFYIFLGVIILLWVIFRVIWFVMRCILYPINFICEFDEKKQREEYMEEYNAFLEEIEGQEFFFYTPKKSSLAFIEEQILPNLSKDVAPVFFSGKECNSELPEEWIRFMLYQNRRQYPFLLKVKKGRVLGVSLHHELHGKVLSQQNHQLFLDIIEQELQKLRKRLR
ncbi:hypothetical protein [Candidatus Uabimicrobium amorphum]|uniref:Uncharacterized protein n=1 Tax=Uabimicrobium amorphum TaxID=2596890 RepID=A0A5S9F2D5_UABAM|nr:hypothetical protein [Candidatus Uabimicrobium amorphum]BBM83318.1 hypothetical protein UABAM_01669 [Candidatus Uabimicrobium amorphum]